MNYFYLRKLKTYYFILVFTGFMNHIGYAQNIDLSNARIIKLEEALQLGLQNNRQLKMANIDLAVSAENKSQAKMVKYPSIGLNMGYNYIGDPKIYEGFYENKNNVDYFNHQSFATIATSMPIYYGGVVNHQIDQQKLLTQLQETVVKMSEADIKMSITNQYFTLEKLYR